MFALAISLALIQGELKEKKEERKKAGVIFVTTKKEGEEAWGTVLIIRKLTPCTSSITNIYGQMRKHAFVPDNDEKGIMLFFWSVVNDCKCI